MNKKELQDFCTKHNFPFTVEFREPWYPKPIEIALKDINDTKLVSENFRQAVDEYDRKISAAEQ